MPGACANGTLARKAVRKQPMAADTQVATRTAVYSMPVADNSTKEGRAQNRRVEIYITANKTMIEKAENGTL